MDEKAKGMKSIRDVERLTGVTRRTLQEYADKDLNLLHPTYRSESKQWFYDDEAVKKLMLITILREIGYERKPIKRMLEDTECDWGRELRRAAVELEKKKKRLEGLMRYAEILSYVAELPEEIIQSLWYINNSDTQYDSDFSAGVEQAVSELSELTDEDINEIKDNSEYIVLDLLLQSIGSMKKYNPRAKCVQRSVMNFYRKLSKLYCEEESIKFSNKLIYSEEFLEEMLAMINSEFILVEDWGKSMKEEYGQDSVEFIKKAFDEFKSLVEVSRDRIA